MTKEIDLRSTPRPECWNMVFENEDFSYRVNATNRPKHFRILIKQLDIELTFSHDTNVSFISDLIDIATLLHKDCSYSKQYVCSCIRSVAYDLLLEFWTNHPDDLVQFVVDAKNESFLKGKSVSKQELRAWLNS